MINPWIIVAALVIWAATLTAAWNHGDTSGFNRAESVRAGQQDAAIAALNEQIAADEVKKAEAVAAADTAKAGLNKALRELRNEKTKPAASCITPDWRMRVNSAVSAINGAASAGGVSGSMPAVAGVRRGSGAVGGGSAGDSR